MNKIFFLIVGIFFTSTSFAQQINDPNAEVRSVKNFHAVHLSSAFDVFITQSNEEAVAVSAAESKFRERIKAEVKNGILYIDFDSKGMGWGSGNKKLKAYISVKQIDALTISGACDVFISGTLKASELTLNQSGASDLKGRIEVSKLKVDLSGASDVSLTGSATQLSIEASGASNFKGFDLTTDICNVKASGASDIKITVNKELSAYASGASDVNYKGSGVIREVKSSGSSSVRKG